MWMILLPISWSCHFWLWCSAQLIWATSWTRCHEFPSRLLNHLYLPACVVWCKGILRSWWSRIFGLTWWWGWPPSPSTSPPSPIVLPACLANCSCLETQPDSMLQSAWLGRAWAAQHWGKGQESHHLLALLHPPHPDSFGPGVLPVRWWSRTIWREVKVSWLVFRDGNIHLFVARQGCLSRQCWAWAS